MAENNPFPTHNVRLLSICRAGKMNQIINVKLDDLKLAENNVRLHPKRQIEEYKRSLAKFGQTKNAVIDEDNNVLIGNGLVIAVRELGWEEIYAIQRNDLSDNDKLKIMVSDNKIYGLGVDNLDVLDEIFDKLAGDLDIPGYDEETLKSMVAEAEAVTSTIREYGVLDDEQIESIKNRAEPKAYTLPETDDAITHPIAATTGASEDSIAEKGDEEKIKLNCPECGVDIWLSREQLQALM